MNEFINKRFKNISSELAVPLMGFDDKLKRRNEIEDITIRNRYIERLIKSQHVLPPENSSFVSDETMYNYEIPWL